MPQFNIRLEDDLISAIKRRARQEGISTSDLCRNALEQYLSSGSIPAIPSTANSAIQHEAIQDISAIPDFAALVARVETLEQEICQLQQSHADDRGDNSQIAEFEPAIGEDQTVNFTDTPPAPGGTVPSGEGLTLQEICEQYQLSYKNLTRNAKAKGQTTSAYLTEQTGVKWVQRGKRYQRLK